MNRRDGSKKDTLINIEQNGEFVVNIVSFDLAETMNQTSAEYPSDESEFSAVGLTELPSLQIKPPRLKESSAQFECSLIQTLHLGTGAGGANVVIGRIELLHIDDAVLDDDGFADAAKLDNIGRLGGASYTRTTDRFDLPRPQLD